MRNILYIARKELKMIFISPMAYAVALAIFLVMGIIFYSNVVNAVYQQVAPTIQIVIGPMATLLLFSVPAIHHAHCRGRTTHRHPRIAAHRARPRLGSRGGEMAWSRCFYVHRFVGHLGLSNHP